MKYWLRIGMFAAVMGGLVFRSFWHSMILVMSESMLAAISAVSLVLILASLAKSDVSWHFYLFLLACATVVAIAITSGFYRDEGYFNMADLIACWGFVTLNIVSWLPVLFFRFCDWLFSDPPRPESGGLFIPIEE